jgi:hypothetical protein
VIDNTARAGGTLERQRHDDDEDAAPANADDLEGTQRLGTRGVHRPHAECHGGQQRDAKDEGEGNHRPGDVLHATTATAARSRRMHTSPHNHDDREL